MLSLEFMVLHGTVEQETGGFGLGVVGQIPLPEFVVTPLISTILMEYYVT